MKIKTMKTYSVSIAPNSNINEDEEFFLELHKEYFDPHTEAFIFNNFFGTNLLDAIESFRYEYPELNNFKFKAINMKK